MTGSARHEGSWSELWRALRTVLARTARRVAARTRSAVSRARWALVAALAGGLAVWLVMPTLVRRTIGGDCRVTVEPISAHIDSNGNLVGDPDACPLTHPEVVAVWLVALAVALLAGLATRRLVRGGRR